jgi:hypothetical protein
MVRENSYYSIDLNSSNTLSSLNNLNKFATFYGAEPSSDIHLTFLGENTNNSGDIVEKIDASPTFKTFKLSKTGFYKIEVSSTFNVTSSNTLPSVECKIVTKLTNDIALGDPGLIDTRKETTTGFALKQTSLLAGVVHNDENSPYYVGLFNFGPNNYGDFENVSVTFELLNQASA